MTQTAIFISDLHYCEIAKKRKRKDEMSRKSAIMTPDDGYRFLAGKVLQRSKIDLKGDDPIAALDSLVWWLWGDGPVMAECLGVYKTPVEIMRWIVGGCGDEEGTPID